jgi:hypothetical protein
MKMLHQMCHEVLAEVDIKAICKSRGLPNQAVSSRTVLESLFLSETGVSVAMSKLDRIEIALLHLLKNQDKPVNVAFFSRLDPTLNKGRTYGTFTQRFQGLFTKVKERLVRAGVLTLALGPESESMSTKMERWQFAVPEPFARHLPPLVESPKRLSGEGDRRKDDLAREKLKTAIAQGADHDAKEDRVEIVKGELRWGGEPFRANRVGEWLKLQWQAETGPATRRKEVEPYILPPAEAVLRILAGLETDHWCDADALAAPLEVFCGARIDASSVCESGWRWGLLARQEADGRKWYRCAPPTVAADTPPEQYLVVRDEEGLTVDLDTVPLESLETLVQISDLQLVAGQKPLLMVTPNLVKIGRTTEATAALPLADWLRKNTPVFHQAFETVRQRRGKTILHENLSVAQIRDLSLKVALQRALGSRLVPLGEEFVAFPTVAVAEVKRLVNQMGHVIKEVPHRES